MTQSKINGRSSIAALTSHLEGLDKAIRGYTAKARALQSEAETVMALLFSKLRNSKHTEHRSSPTFRVYLNTKRIYEVQDWGKIVGFAAKHEPDLFEKRLRAPKVNEFLDKGHHIPGLTYHDDEALFVSRAKVKE